MPKKRSLWKRETKCLTCEADMINYQYITKSQKIVYDDWMVAHMEPVGEYEPFPDVLKTTVCPNCFTASNEYNFGVEQYQWFYRSPTKNNQVKEVFEKVNEERFHVLTDVISMFERECAILDKKNNRPVHTRTRATFEKIWQNKEQYGIPFFTLMFAEPRDYITAFACFALDRYCQMLRIAYNYDVEPSSWEHDSLKQAIEDEFIDKSLDMKSPEPRFYFIGTNYLQSLEFLDELKKTMDQLNEETYNTLVQEYWEEAYKFMKISFSNDDISAIPLELKEGGMNLLMAKLHFKFENTEEGLKCLRFSRNYADNRIKQISSTNQQNFVNEVDALSKQYLEDHKEKEEEEEAAEEATTDKKKKKK